ncbi:MAG: RNA methyltransferase [Bacteroidales bacterium]|nr:RNA methyltransferase [Bacteroidales bacterium]
MIIEKSKNEVSSPTLTPSTKSFKMIGKTMFGLEEILAEELRNLGAQDIEPINRAVAFTGTMETLYKANYCCRTALAILKPFAEFEANNEQELYDNVNQIKWEQIMDVDCTFFIESAANSKIFTNSYYAALKTKDAIVDRFRRMFGRRPTIETENADYKFNLHITNNKVTLLMNSSGDSLHKRGYRQGVGIAPINEVLAAGLIQLSGWKADSNFYDPMCGSGTLLIEAAMYANNIPAQYYRKKFGFMKWKNYTPSEWKSVKEKADRNIKDFDYEICGCDIDRNVLEQAEKNLRFTKLHHDVCLYHDSFQNQDAPEGECMIITNPPYGERITIDDLNSLYSSIGDKFKSFGNGKTAWLITSDFRAMKNIGLKPSRKIQLYNGALECRFLKFDLYDGSKKAKYQNDEDYK